MTEHEQDVRDIMVTLFYNETILKGYTREKIIATRKESQKLEKLENAKNLLKEGLPVELIARALNLSPAKINEIKAQMEN